MKVYDYELLNNIDMLYEAPIIIYGAGAKGKDVLKILEGMKTEICCFCDRDYTKTEFCGYKVVNIEKLSEICKKSGYIFVIASEFHFEDMINELEIRNISTRYIFTEWSIVAALSFNTDNDKIPKAYLKSYEHEALSELEEAKKNTALRKMNYYFDNHPQILVYQMSKVGSSSLYHQLNKYNINAMHVHTFHNFYEDQKEAYLLYDKFQNEINTNGAKIISMVREPIARLISFVFQAYNFASYNVKDQRKNINERILKDLTGYIQKGDIYPWFHDELEYLTGINVYEYPFDKEKGYSVIKKDNIEILLLTMENMDNNEQTIADFAGINEFKLCKDNVGENKEYKYAYKRTKDEIEIPEDILDYYYNDNLQLKHFYTEQQIENFRSKWERNIK
jgi:hypothetical protein